MPRRDIPSAKSTEGRGRQKDAYGFLQEYTEPDLGSIAPLDPVLQNNQTTGGEVVFGRGSNQIGGTNTSQELANLLFTGIEATQQFAEGYKEISVKHDSDVLDGAQEEWDRRKLQKGTEDSNGMLTEDGKPVWSTLTPEQRLLEERSFLKETKKKLWRRDNKLALRQDIVKNKMTLNPLKLESKIEDIRLERMRLLASPLSADELQKRLEEQTKIYQDWVDSNEFIQKDPVLKATADAALYGLQEKDFSTAEAAMDSFMSEQKPVLEGLLVKWEGHLLDQGIEYGPEEDQFQGFIEFAKTQQNATALVSVLESNDAFSMRFGERLAPIYTQWRESFEETAAENTRLTLIQRGVEDSSLWLADVYDEKTGSFKARPGEGTVFDNPSRFASFSVHLSQIQENSKSSRSANISQEFGVTVTTFSRLAQARAKQLFVQNGGSMDDAVQAALEDVTKALEHTAELGGLNWNEASIRSRANAIEKELRKIHAQDGLNIAESNNGVISKTNPVTEEQEVSFNLNSSVNVATNYPNGIPPEIQAVMLDTYQYAVAQRLTTYALESEENGGSLNRIVSKIQNVAPENLNRHQLSRRLYDSIAEVTGDLNIPEENRAEEAAKRFIAGLRPSTKALESTENGQRYLKTISEIEAYVLEHLTTFMSGFSLDHGLQVLHSFADAFNQDTREGQQNAIGDLSEFPLNLDWLNNYGLTVSEDGDVTLSSIPDARMLQKEAFLSKDPDKIIAALDQVAPIPSIGFTPGRITRPEDIDQAATVLTGALITTSDALEALGIRRNSRTYKQVLDIQVDRLVPPVLEGNSNIGDQRTYRMRLTSLIHKLHEIPQMIDEGEVNPEYKEVARNLRESYAKYAEIRDFEVRAAVAGPFDSSGINDWARQNTNNPNSPMSTFDEGWWDGNKTNSFTTYLQKIAPQDFSGFLQDLRINAMAGDGASFANSYYASIGYNTPTFENFMAFCMENNLSLQARKDESDKIIGYEAVDRPRVSSDQTRIFQAAPNGLVSAFSPEDGITSLTTMQSLQGISDSYRTGELTERNYQAFSALIYFLSNTKSTEGLKVDRLLRDDELDFSVRPDDDRSFKLLRLFTPPEDIREQSQVQGQWNEENQAQIANDALALLRGLYASPYDRARRDGKDPNAYGLDGSYKIFINLASLHNLEAYLKDATTLSDPHSFYDDPTLQLPNTEIYKDTTFRTPSGQRGLVRRTQVERLDGEFETKVSTVSSMPVSLPRSLEVENAEDFTDEEVVRFNRRESEIFKASKTIEELEKSLETSIQQDTNFGDFITEDSPKTLRLREQLKNAKSILEGLEQTTPEVFKAKKSFKRERVLTSKEQVEWKAQSYPNTILEDPRYISLSEEKRERIKTLLEIYQIQDRSLETGKVESFNIQDRIADMLDREDEKPNYVFKNVQWK